VVRMTKSIPLAPPGFCSAPPSLPSTVSSIGAPQSRSLL
jgi:hypothetical protein